MYTHTETNIDDEQIFWDNVVLEILSEADTYKAFHQDTPKELQKLADRLVEVRRESAQKRKG